MLNQKGAVPLPGLIAILGIIAFFSVSLSAPFKDRLLTSIYPKEESLAQVVPQWAFEEKFDQAPSSPSQDLLPKTFDYVTTHRTHPSTHNGQGGKFALYPADHDPGHCKASNDPGALSTTNPLLQHNVETTHTSDMTNPDKSFYICNNHMMSSMGEVEGYSVTSFWPKQEFDFAQGGVLEFDVNINDRGWDVTHHSRNWWEVMIVPRDQIQMGAAKDWLPIDETYPRDRIIFDFDDRSRREMHVGRGTAAPGGVITDCTQCDWSTWRDPWNAGPNDPALTDPRIRRKNRIEISNNQIKWSIQKQDGTFHTISMNVPEGLPFTRGVVMFKTHAYTPDKDGVHKLHSFHWDNIRFSGPVLPPYENHEWTGLMYLQANGSAPIGSTKTFNLNLPKVGSNPVILGQTNGGMPGQVLLSINGNPNMTVSPHSTSSKDNPCFFGGWRTFRIPINPAQLKVGENTFKWTIGPRPACASGQGYWDGFSVKAFEIQFDGTTTTTTPSPSPLPSPLPSPSVKPGDIDGNNKVDIFDFNQLLTDFGRTGPNIAADLDRNGRVDIFDFNILLTNFGK